MYCPRCGTEQPPDAVQCVCGEVFPAIALEPADTAVTHQLTFHGDGANLLAIAIVNLLLTYCTLGIYYFWAKVKIRKYFYSQTELAGARFAFHGTGKEIFFGWLKVMAAVVTLMAIYLLLRFKVPAPYGLYAATAVLYISFFLLTAIAVVGSLRYRLSRSSYRGIRFSFRGHAKEFMVMYLGGLLLTFITLGFYSAFFDVRVRRFLTSKAWFGNRAFEFEGEGRDLFKPWVISLLLTIPTLGICWIWYAARRQRYFWSRTSYGNLRFRSTLEGQGLLGLVVTNLLMLVFTLGIAYTWVQVRTTKYLYEHMFVNGLIDWAAIEQDARAASAAGEGLAEFMDAGLLDVDLGI